MQKERITMNRISYYIPGGLLVFLGLLIVVFPEILVALVAAVVIFIGAGALFFGHQMRKAQRSMRAGYEGTEYDDDGFCRVWSRRYPSFGRWGRRF